MRRVVALLLACGGCAPLLARDVVQVARCVRDRCCTIIIWKKRTLSMSFIFITACRVRTPCNIRRIVPAMACRMS